MFKKIIKIIGIVLGVLMIAGVLFYTKVYISTEKRIHKVYTFEQEEIILPTDSASLALGSRLVTTRGCRSCHGGNLAGRVLINEPKTIGRIIAKNITRGRGGLRPDFRTEDWLNALKHGVRKNKTPLLLMPSHRFAKLTKSDLAAIIAYCSQLPPVENVLPKNTVGPLGRVLMDQGKMSLLAAEEIDHDQPFSEEITPAHTVAYGKYLALVCAGCHGEDMKGGEPTEPGAPLIANISSTGNPGRWTDKQFIATLRSGKTPEGKQLRMPWEMAAAYTDEELKALHLYLKSL